VLVDEPMAIKLTLLAVALGSCLTSVEYLYALSRDGLGSRSLFAWEICGCRQGWLFRGLPAQLMNWCFQPSPFAALMIVRIAGCVALVALTDRCWFYLSLCDTNAPVLRPLREAAMRRFLSQWSW
jgi:hypothetical protein